MSEKLLLVSLVDINPNQIDYNTLKKEWEEYKKVGVLREYSSALFLYLSARNYSTMSKLLNYEKIRILKKINRNNYQEILKEVPLEDREYYLFKELIKRFGIDKHIKITKETIGLNPTKQTTIKMTIETAVLLNIINVIKNTNTIMKIQKGEVTIIPQDRKIILKIVNNIYINMLQQLITQNRNQILQKYNSQSFEKIAEKENIYEYKLTKFPPCIEQALNGDIPEGQRNNVMFSLINFLKASVIMYGANYTKEDITNMIIEANNKMPSPLPEREIRSLIKYHINQHFFKIYGWCNKMQEAGLCTEKNFSTCMRKYFKKQHNTKKLSKNKNISH